MTDSASTRTWMPPVALRISASSGLPLQPAKAAPCVLDLLGHVRPQAHVTTKSVIYAKIPPVPVARASWMTVVGVCAIAVVLFAIGGYTGYAITVGAVGLAAAVNLLPSP
jgi:hypothetical protein